MFCSNCGAKIPEDSKWCSACGAVVETDGSDVENGMSENVIAKEKQEERKENKLLELIIDPNEKLITGLCSGYMENMLHSGELKSNFGILTDKRFYLKGKCYMRSATGYESVEDIYSVDLEDITATGFTLKTSFRLLVLAIIAIVAGIAAAMVESGGVAGVFLMSALVLFFAYLFMQRTYYEISFAGGSLSVNVSDYGGEKETRAFNKALRLEKDKCRERSGK